MSSVLTEVNMDNVSQRVEELENAVRDAIDYVIGCLGSSYCETDNSDWEILHEFEKTLGVPLTNKNTFYY